MAAPSSERFIVPIGEQKTLTVGEALQTARAGFCSVFTSEPPPAKIHSYEDLGRLQKLTEWKELWFMRDREERSFRLSSGGAEDDWICLRFYSVRWGGRYVDPVVARLHGPLRELPAGKEGFRLLCPPSQIPAFAPVSYVEFGLRSSIAGYTNAFRALDGQVVTSVAERLYGSLARSHSPEGCTIEVDFAQNHPESGKPHLSVRMIGPGEAPLRAWEHLGLKELYGALPEGQHRELGVRRLYSAGFSYGSLGGTIDEFLRRETTLLDLPQEHVLADEYEH